MDVNKFWNAIISQNENQIREFFDKNAYINWHCTNEHFNLDEFIIANCEYPGQWEGKVERIEMIDDLIITATIVYPKDRSSSFHVISFIRTLNDKIVSMDEYWSDDDSAPQWRLEKCIGKPIK